MIPLFQRYPHLIKALPYHSLGHYPTPVRPLHNLEKSFSSASLWVKEDDKSSSLYGGNKVRKLEWEFGKAISQGATSLLAYGSMGSNFTMATCLFGRDLGLPVRLILFKSFLSEQTRRNYIRNTSLSQSHVLTASPLCVPYYVVKDKLSQSQTGTYILPPGGTSPLSTLGYINAMLELDQQIKSGELPTPDTIYLAVGTGGTLAGLLIGKALCGLSSKILGVTVVEGVLTSSYLIKRQMKGALSFFNKVSGENLNPQAVLSGLNLCRSFIGQGYAHPTPAGDSAIRLLGDEESLILDPTYTGKAMSAFLSHLDASRDSSGVHLFWNTFNSAPLPS